MMEYWNIGYKSGKDLFYIIDRIHLTHHSRVPIFQHSNYERSEVRLTIGNQ